ncbi:DASH complex subunit dam1 [Malassezia obtusa]|uniref:DASH complex subunit DAM1 n=1 Tax=Malassezia obtusa TaxID=76774 RepID=A0AAF0IXE2_9BASI|nr:DASH complex subunit dam1 [Malassezia obtusa]
MSAPRHTSTPIRRISSGSFAFGSRSQSHAATPLSFLQDEALPMLAEETSALHENLAQMTEIEGALRTFNESFAAFLYGIKMNAFCIEWPEAPSEENLARARRRTADPATAPNPAASTPAPGAPVDEDDSYTTDPDLSTGDLRVQPRTTKAQSLRASQRPTRNEPDRRPTASTSRRAPERSTTRAPPPEQRPRAGSARFQESTRAKTHSEASRSRVGAATSRSAETAQARTAPKRIPLATKRRREAFAEDIIDTMPLEYRNGDAGQRRLLQSVILALLSSGEQGMRVADIASPPDLPTGKVNKALIALLAANHVVRTSVLCTA